jgi:hypothetical protein
MNPSTAAHQPFAPDRLALREVLGRGDDDLDRARGGDAGGGPRLRLDPL